MSDPHSSSQDSEEIVAYKVKRQVAKKALRDVQKQVDQIERQVDEEKRNVWIVLPIILVLALFMVLVVVWP